MWFAGIANVHIRFISMRARFAFSVFFMLAARRAVFNRLPDA